MRRAATSPLILGLITGLVLTVVSGSAGGQDSLESRLLSLINGGRSSHLVAHSGLRMAGRQHSAEMAGTGSLNHNGAAARINGAQPDPAEPDGPPDNGFTGTWCENVAYVRGAPDSEVAQRMYNGWRNSPSHNRCMNNSEMTVAGVGMYYDSSTNTWWATLESAVDRTLPGSGPIATREPDPTPAGSPTAQPTQPALRTEPPEPTERPERTEPPFPVVRTAPPEPTSRPQPTASTRTVGGRSERVLAASTLPASSARRFGWIELGATLAVLLLAAETMRRLSRRPDLADGGNL